MLKALASVARAPIHILFSILGRHLRQQGRKRNAYKRTKIPKITASLKALVNTICELSDAKVTCVVCS